MTTTVAVLGMGAMGSRMAQRLLKAGFNVRVYNRTRARCDALEAEGATVCATPRDAAVSAEFVMSMVRDDDASARLWLDPQSGALGGLEPGAIAVESSTLSAKGVARLISASAELGVAFVDAPVVGTRPHAETGALVFLAGGNADRIDQLKPIFDVLGGATHHAGPQGSGVAMKLAVNALFGIQVAAVAELLAALRRAGIEASTAMNILGSLAVCSGAAKGAGQAMVAERFEPLFPVDLVAKDFAYARELAEGSSADVPLVDTAHGVYERAVAAGFAQDNIVGVAKLYR